MQLRHTPISKAELHTEEGSGKHSCQSSCPVQTCTPYLRYQKTVSMGRKKRREAPGSSLVTLWLWITCDLGNSWRSQSRPHRELSSQRCKCQCGCTGSPSEDSETKRNTIRYDEQKAHFLYVTWSSRKGVNIKGEWTQFQGPINSKMQRTLFWIIYTNSACLLSTQAGSLQTREWEME